MTKVLNSQKQPEKSSDDDRLAILKDILVGDAKNDLLNQIQTLQATLEKNQQTLLDNISQLSDKIANDFSALQKNTENKLIELDDKLSGSLNQETAEISKRLEKIHADLNDSIVRHFETSVEKIKETENKLDHKKADQKTISTLLHSLATQLEK